MRRRITALLIGAVVLVATSAVGQQAAVAEPSKADQDICRADQPRIRYVFKVRTGPRLGAGTDADVYFRVWGSNVSNWHMHKRSFFDVHVPGKPPQGGPNLFEQGSTDNVYVYYCDPGHVSTIAVWMARGGWGSDWYLGSITFQHLHRADQIFSYNRWITPGVWTFPT